MEKETAPAAPSDEQRAINAAALMIQTGAGPNEEAMNFTREFYADTVDYFKKKRPKSEILADKKAYFARWPIRRFVVDQTTTTPYPARHAARPRRARRTSPMCWTCATATAL
ncbi:hypothetical protein G6F31_019797 [Rhizopus arrhizus]|nr:hypothetical protein G6F31_019797 [Rhizopus arrhizus]